MRRSIGLFVVIILGALCCFGINAVYASWTRHATVLPDFLPVVPLALAAASFAATLLLERVTDYPSRLILLALVAGTILGDVAPYVVEATRQIARGMSPPTVFQSFSEAVLFFSAPWAIQGFSALVGATLALPFVGRKSQSREKRGG